MRILIADDDRFMRRRLQLSLAQGGYDVLDADDGQTAWDVLQREQIQLVITDWMMPHWDGPELIQRVRAADLPSYTYFILLTGNDSKEDIAQGLAAGADDYLTKPFDHSALLARVAIGKRILDLEARLTESRDQLRETARRDALTGLLNHYAIYEHAEAEISRAGREDRPISLILLDLDRFKFVNDRYGHMVGDEALRLLARTIAGNTRPYDFVGRWGGAEFLVVLPGTTLAETAAVAERLRASVAAASLPLADRSQLELRVSAGVTGAPSGAGQRLELLIQQADQALSRAKEKGRNRVSVFTAV
ncbi:MAG: GGDEF domain-containing protein [Roseiflexaceae bacterium]